jgi:hypothetical protein
MKVNRYIAAILLFCFSAFLGHSLVPHPHHSVVDSPLASDCPFEHSDQHRHDQDSDADQDAEENPTHCHAFNDVVFERYNAPVIKTWTNHVLVLMLSRQTSLPDTPVVDNSRPYSRLSLACRSLTDEGTRALRAPPSFV